MRIQHNVTALNAHRNLTNNNNALSKNLEKLSSGYRINRAGDDAAGLAISEKMRAQVAGLDAAQKNAEDGVALVQTAEGALTEVHSMLNRMVTLATQSANGTYSEANREEMQKEINALNEEIDRISSTSNFNGTKLFTGGVTGPEKTAVQDVAAGATDSKAAFTVDFKGASVESAGKIAVSIAGKSYEVEFTEDEVKAGVDGKAIAAKVKDLATDIKDGTAGPVFSDVQVSDNTKLVFTAAANGVMSNDFDALLDKGVTVAGKTTTTDVDLHVGESSSDDNTIGVSIKAMSSASIGRIENGALTATGSIGQIDITTAATAKDAIDAVNDAIDSISSIRSDLGAIQNRLEHTINNLGVQNENITAAEARIRDVDMAKEMMTYTKNNILIQASQSMLAQANMVPQGVLQLLQ